MTRIYNIIPGNLVNDSIIADRIFALIDSVEFDDWIEVNEKIYASEFFQLNKEFYVMYLDPRGIIKKLYVSSSAEILSFMKENISYEYGEGIDIAICKKEVDNAVICNHDGQIYILKV